MDATPVAAEALEAIWDMQVYDPIAQCDEDSGESLLASCAAEAYGIAMTDTLSALGVIHGIDYADTVTSPMTGSPIGRLRVLDTGLDVETATPFRAMPTEGQAAVISGTYRTMLERRNLSREDGDLLGEGTASGFADGMTYMMRVLGINFGTLAETGGDGGEQ